MKNITLKSSLSIVLKVIAILLVLWFFISYMEIVMHNLTPGYDYWDGNIIIKYIETFLI